MLEFIQKKYGFSNYQTAQLEYLFKTVLSELSKFIILGIFFRNELTEYFAAVILMLLLRCSTGGLHCKRYLSCLALSAVFVYLPIRVLPAVHITKLAEMIMLFLAMMINYFLGPVTSVYRRNLKSTVLMRSRLQAFAVIFFYLILTYILPENHYITICVWVILLHTLQLMAAKVLRQFT